MKSKREIKCAVIGLVLGLVIVTGISYGQHDWVDSKSIDQHDIKIKYNPKTGFPERVKGLIGNFKDSRRKKQIVSKKSKHLFVDYRL